MALITPKIGMRQHFIVPFCQIGQILKTGKIVGVLLRLIVKTKFEVPKMEDSSREELDAFVIKRKREGGAPTDF